MSAKGKLCVLGLGLVLLALGGTAQGAPLARAAMAPVLGPAMPVTHGVDMWATAGGELTVSSFEQDPIPAGFFCTGSEPFTGKVRFNGRPLATEPAGSLGSIDTLVSRLDDATFDANNVAFTRIQLLALSLVSAAPITTRCGNYDVAASLAGEQPETRMKILRTSERGGHYRAPLALNVKLTFTPAAGNPNPARELQQRIDLGPGTYSVWSYQSPSQQGEIRVDTNGDRQPDTLLPAASNFLAGVEPAVLRDGTPTSRIMTTQGGILCPTPLCPYHTCHCTGWDDDPTYDQPAGQCESSHLHCTWVCARLPYMECASIGPPLEGP
jgi:hypothetical protein